MARTSGVCVRQATSRGKERTKKPPGSTPVLDSPKPTLFMSTLTSWRVVRAYAARAAQAA
jgi:hypothetical protein